MMNHRHTGPGGINSFAAQFDSASKTRFAIRYAFSPRAYILSPSEGCSSPIRKNHVLPLKSAKIELVGRKFKLFQQPLSDGDPLRVERNPSSQFPRIPPPSRSLQGVDREIPMFQCPGQPTIMMG